MNVTRLLLDLNTQSVKEKGEKDPDQQRINLLERKVCHYQLQKSIEEEKLDKIDRL